MSAPLPSSILEVFEHDLSIIQIEHSVEVAAAMLATYDVLIAFDDEVKLVWGRRWAWTTPLYLLNRYLVPIRQWLDIAGGLDASLSIEACGGWAFFSQWSIPCFTILIEAVLLLRVQAMYADKRVSIPLFVLFLGCSIGSLLAVGLTLKGVTVVPGPLPQIVPCGLSGSNTFLWATWLFSLVMETVLFSFTVIRTVRTALGPANTPLVTILLRDGTLYFSVIFVFMLANTLIWAKAPFVWVALLQNMTLSISSVLSSRMFLNLRSIAYRYAREQSEGDSNTSPSGSDTVELPTVPETVQYTSTAVRSTSTWTTAP